MELILHKNLNIIDRITIENTIERKGEGNEYSVLFVVLCVRLAILDHITCFRAHIPLSALRMG